MVKKSLSAADVWCIIDNVLTQCFSPVSKYPRHDVVPDSPSPELPAPHQKQVPHQHQHQLQQQQQQDVTYFVLEPGHNVR